MTGKPTLLFLVTEDWYFVSHRIGLARAAVAAGYRVVVATRVREHGEIITAAGCEVRPLGWRRAGNTPLSHLIALREIVALYKEVRPDLSHHVALKAVVFGSYAAQRAMVRARVNALAGMGFYFTSDSLQARVVRPALSTLLRLALRGPGQRVIVQNRDDFDVLLSAGVVDRPRLSMIRGAGVDPLEFMPSPPPSGSPVVVLVARMLREKGIVEFVTAARSLKGRGIDARFVLVGDTDSDNPGGISRAELDRWHAEGVVEWWGHRNDIAEVLRQATIFCLPSYREGMPRSMLEAASAGLPIVTTDVPGCREVIRRDENGKLVPLGDQAALEAALAELLTSPAERARLGAAARASVLSEFSLERVIADTLRVYRDLLTS